MKYFIAALVVLLLFLNMKTSFPTTEPLAADATVLAVGDSLTYGYGAPLDKSYPAQLSQLSGLTVINAGINGETSREGLVRLPKLLETYHPNLTILCFGGNDILQRKPLGELKENLRKMIQTCKDAGSLVLLIAVPDITLFGLEPLDLYEEVAEETGTPLLQGVLSMVLSRPSLKSDQIHPNAQGYMEMARAIHKKLKALNLLP